MRIVDLVVPKPLMKKTKTEIPDDFAFKKRADRLEQI